MSEAKPVQTVYVSQTPTTPYGYEPQRLAMPMINALSLEPANSLSEKIDDLNAEKEHRTQNAEDMPSYQDLNRRAMNELGAQSYVPRPDKKYDE